MNDDLDIRITDALFDGAAGTTTSDDALARILQRAETRRPAPPGRRLLLGAGAAVVAAAGVAGIVVLGPDRGAAPSSNVSVVSAPDTTVPEDPSATLPATGYVEGDLFYDDATLLSQLFVNFQVGSVEDESRWREDDGSTDYSPMVECMQDLGWQYLPPTGSHRDALTEHPRFVMAPEDFAARYGFGASAEALGLIPSEFPAATRDDELPQSADEQQAYFDAEAECQAEVGFLDDVPIAPQAWIAAKDYVWTQFEPLVLNDERVVDAFERWQQCMEAEGLSYERPETIASGFHLRLREFEPWTFPVEAGTPAYTEIEAIMVEEIAVATANAGCVVPYHETLRSVIVERFDEYKSMLQAAIDAEVAPQGQG